MSWVEGIVVYVLIWWVVIFAILPLGIRPSEHPVPGEAPGAPENPDLWRKAAITTAVSAVIWLGIYALIRSGMISFRAL